MTIGELIEELKKHPSDMRVVVNGYESGSNDVSLIDEIPIKVNCNEEWCYGDHSICEEEEKDEIALSISGEAKLV